MDQKTMGTVVSVKRQWWFKVNAKPVRMHPLDGAAFAHMIKVEYAIGGRTYTKRKWLGAGCPVPIEGSLVTVCYDEDKPSRAKVI